jgi:hypothetical protein
MIRCFLVLLACLLGGCTQTQGLDLVAEPSPCEPGQSLSCECDGGGLGTQGCEPFEKTWGDCMCPSASSDAASDSVHDQDGSHAVSSMRPGEAALTVGGASLTSPNYQLRLVIPTGAASLLLSSESYRLRLGSSAPKENP